MFLKYLSILVLKANGMSITVESKIENSIPIPNISLDYDCII